MRNREIKYGQLLGLILCAGLTISGCFASRGTKILSGQEKPVILHVQPPQTERSLPLESAGTAREPMRLRIDSAEYRLPMAVRELTLEGWRLDPRYDGEWAKPGTYLEGIIFTRDDQTIHCIVGNPSADQSIPLSQGMIAGIQWRAGKSLSAKIRFSDPLSPDLSLPEAEANLGQPVSTGAGIKTYRKDGVQWEISAKNGSASRISVISLSPSLSQNPSGRIMVRKPSWGEDPTTGRILIDGDFFRLPAQLDQFEASGWVKGRSLEMLLPNSESVVRMDKDGYALSLGVINRTDQIQALRDCPVISVRPSSSQTGLLIELTHTLKTGMPSSEAIGFLAPYKPRVKAVDELVFYEVIRNQMKIRLVINTEQAALVSIEYEWKEDFPGPDPVNPLVPG